MERWGWGSVNTDGSQGLWDAVTDYPPAPDLKGKGGRTIPPKPGPMTYCSVTLVSYLTSRIGAPQHRVVVRIEIIL